MLIKNLGMKIWKIYTNPMPNHAKEKYSGEASTSKNINNSWWHSGTYLLITTWGIKHVWR